MSTKCRYCGSTSYGSTCIHSPTRKHDLCRSLDGRRAYRITPEERGG